MTSDRQDETFHLSRRGLLAGGAAALSMTALAACGRSGTSAKVATTPIGIQLYTVRAEMEKDFAGTLKRIAAIGYQEVEFHNYFDHSPADVRQLLADLGLKSPSVHMNAREMRDNPDPLIEQAKEVGHEFALIAWTMPEDRETLDQYKGWADVCNDVAERCKNAGLRFAYHNHNFEFEPIDGVLPYDILMQNTDPSLVGFELDFYWAKAAGQNISDVLSKAPERFPLCHIKDMDPSGAMADVGAGIIDFTDILASKVASGIEHYYVERDDATAPFESAAISHAALETIMGKVAALRAQN